MHKLPELPYELNALEPHISRETLEYHWGKHHNTYVNNLNKKIEGTELASKTLEEIVKQTQDQGTFNNAAQHWNHTFYWYGLGPNGGGDPKHSLGDEINKHFGSMDDFRQKFTDTATATFGSGWTWLVKNADGSLAIVNTHDAANPMRDNQQPLLTCDMWEHAYYIDRRNDKGSYLGAFWELVNWDFVQQTFDGKITELETA